MFMVYFRSVYACSFQTYFIHLVFGHPLLFVMIMTDNYEFSSSQKQGGECTLIILLYILKTPLAISWCVFHYLLLKADRISIFCEPCPDSVRQEEHVSCACKALEDVWMWNAPANLSLPDQTSSCQTCPCRWPHTCNFQRSCLSPLWCAFQMCGSASKWRNRSVDTHVGGVRLVCVTAEELPL